MGKKKRNYNAAGPVPAWCMLSGRDTACCPVYGRQCDRCGWNPEIQADRAERIRNRDFAVDKRGFYYIRILASRDAESILATAPAGGAENTTAEAENRTTDGPVP